jgi:hypothetical protein
MAAVRAYCGWHIAPSRDETLVLDGPGGNVLCLPSLYVTDVTLITENGTDLADGSDPEVPAQYQWSQAGIVRRSWAGCSWSGWSGAWWTTELRGIAVTLTHGYDDWPIELAGIIQAVAGRITDNPTGLEQQTVGPFTEKYATSGSGGAGTAFAAADESVLARYRLPPRP